MLPLRADFGWTGSSYVFHVGNRANLFFFQSFEMKSSEIWIPQTAHILFLITLWNNFLNLPLRHLRRNEEKAAQRRSSACLTLQVDQSFKSIAFASRTGGQTAMSQIWKVLNFPQQLLMGRVSPFNWGLFYKVSLDLRVAKVSCLHMGVQFSSTVFPWEAKWWVISMRVIDWWGRELLRAKPYGRLDLETEQRKEG